MELSDKIRENQENFRNELGECVTVEDLDKIYIKYHSKTKGESTLLIKELPELPFVEKRRFGPILNSLIEDQKKAIENTRTRLETQALQDPSIDLTLPLPPKRSGYLHPTTQTIREMNRFFRYYGFSVIEGPEIENVEYNFRKLNLPEGHPATDLQDTLFIKQPEILLRTHTSSVEARILTKRKPPIRVVIPGRVYRNETPNKTNSPFFHHYQGVVVDKGITLQNLKYILDLFHRFLFGEDIELRFRHKYYPEVSPGMGVDIKCRFCNGNGCEVCKFRGWIEVLGSGMIHYNTLKMCGIDPEEYTGFAFGMGIDRLVMARFGIEDIRKLYGKGISFK